MLARHLSVNRCNALGTRRITVLRLYSASKNQHNQAIIDLLKRSADQEEEERKLNCNNFKVHAFAQAIETVSKVDQPIRLGNDIRQLRGVGPGIMTRINEFLYANAAMESRHPNLKDEVIMNRAMTMLQSVPGIGPTTAKKLAEAGCTSLADLRLPQFTSMLSAKQATRVKYMGHLEQPIAREDAEDLLSFCRESLDPKYEITLVGDYRRGSSSFPEITMMVSHPDFVHVPMPIEPSPFQTTVPKGVKRPRKKWKTDDKQTNLLDSSIIPTLEQRALLAETLKSDMKSWEGVVRLPELNGEWGSRTDRIAGIENVEGRFRRVKIHFVPQKSLGSSLLYLTGDSEFHNHICYQAKQSGMIFNEYGLWKWTLSEPHTSSRSTPDCDSTVEEESVGEELEKGYWSLVKSATEEDIFEELGMDYIDPTKRNFLFVAGKAKRPRTGSVAR